MNGSFGEETDPGDQICRPPCNLPVISNATKHFSLSTSRALSPEDGVGGGVIPGHLLIVVSKE